MFKVRRRRRDAERTLSAEGRCLAGLVDACMVMACADGELADEEFEVIAQVIDGFFDGHVTRADIETLMQDSLDAIEREGAPRAPRHRRGAPRERRAPRARPRRRGHRDALRR